MTQLPHVSSGFYSPLGLRALAETIDRFLVRGELSQNKLAVLAGVAPSTLTSIRRNRGNTTEIAYAPEPDIILRIAMWMDKDPEELLLMARGFNPTQYVSKFTNEGVNEPQQNTILKRFKQLSPGDRLAIAGEILRVLSDDFSVLNTDAIFRLPEEVQFLCESLLEEFLRVLESQGFDFSNNTSFQQFCDRLNISTGDRIARRFRDIVLTKQTEPTDVAVLKLGLEQLTGQSIDLSQWRLSREDCDCIS